MQRQEAQTHELDTDFSSLLSHVCTCIQAEIIEELGGGAFEMVWTLRRIKTAEKPQTLVWMSIFHHIHRKEGKLSSRDSAARRAR